MATARPITFGPQVCARLAEGATREWLVPDGVGGYAMGTVSGLRTRRYHGLLVVADHTPASRRLGLASLDPVVTCPSGAVVRLGVHEWADGAISPTGHRLLAGFALVDGVPRWRWRLGEVVIEREIAAVHGRPAVAIVHRLVSGGPVRLTLEALCTWRDAHGERTANGPPPAVTAVADGCVVENAYRINGPGFTPGGDWFRDVRHRTEEERGLTSTEDLWYAGSFHVTLDRPGEIAEVSAWAGDLNDPPPPAGPAVAAARLRNRAVVAAAAPADDIQATLALAADAFVVHTVNGPDVVAGYPWFGAWSRDTMTSYEGLFLATNRSSEGRELLRAYAGTLSEGMLANTADTGGVEYNTVDGTLWFLHAVGRHVAATGDDDLAVELLPALRDIVAYHLAGTRYGIGADPADGLLRAGAPGEALTWMDARVDGVPVTARAGKPVEVNALWINGLATVLELSARTGSPPGPAERACPQAREGFARLFPAPGGLLHDVVGDPGPAASIANPVLRPNQLLAWSLPHAPARPNRAVLDRLGATLLTPLGPRSLAPGEAGYSGRHRGTPAERDRAYHTGTVWPWLTGSWATALHRLGLSGSDLLADIEGHLAEHGLGSISETADGDPPHRATGCPFQAWSVAEHLRARRL
ncbi:amylo-alpha-1,6-glucosidase [Actinoplanes sp. NEAU-A12]|uniref:Amylo-alpha-1,6-glucosidase n=1 Tax=Actinoplanes sandaracinus TaxID=3045177 RepID=A0ABT6WRX1_9ACTN|nr:amylo-alpha-1,6-glucosidase [Actinoplanes sandaracinus]MDI6102489.1 amylo-alpha-1,6-glucosidase [Actinoplanes sandaracinus]